MPSTNQEKNSQQYSVNFNENNHYVVVNRVPRPLKLGQNSVKTGSELKDGKRAATDVEGFEGLLDGVFLDVTATSVVCVHRFFAQHLLDDDVLRHDAVDGDAVNEDVVDQDPIDVANGQRHLRLHQQLRRVKLMSHNSCHTFLHVQFSIFLYLTLSIFN